MKMKITKRDSDLLQLNYYNPNVTYSELGKHFGISRQRAFQILKSKQGYDWYKPRKIYTCSGCGKSFNGRSGVGGNAPLYCVACVGKYYNGKIKKENKKKVNIKK